MIVYLGRLRNYAKRTYCEGITNNTRIADSIKIHLLFQLQENNNRIQKVGEKERLVSKSK